MRDAIKMLFSASTVIKKIRRAVAQLTYFTGNIEKNNIAVTYSSSKSADFSMI